MEQKKRILIDEPVIVPCADGTLALVYGHQIASHEDAQNIIRRLQRFYKTHTPEDIHHYNKMEGRPSTEGFVYLIRREDGAYKIGKTVDLKQRMINYKYTERQGLELIHTIESNDYHQAEMELHARYASKRIRGEWFSLTPEDVACIKELDRLNY